MLLLKFKIATDQEDIQILWKKKKPDKPTFESPKILGQLYHTIDATEFEDYHKKLELNTKDDTRMLVKGMENYIWPACELKR